jgi:hypothetical protein
MTTCKVSQSFLILLISLLCRYISDEWLNLINTVNAICRKFWPYTDRRGAKIEKFNLYKNLIYVSDGM